MEEPKIADKKPFITELEAGKIIAWCTCGLSEKDGGAFCDTAHRGTSFKSFKFSVEENKTAALCMCKRTGNPPYCDGSHVGL